MIEQREIRVCGDCLYVEANGLDTSSGILDAINEMTPDSTWPGFLPEWQHVGGTIQERYRTWLWSHAQHGDGTPDDEDPEYCEGHFSSLPCDGCGTHLGGERYCVTAVLV